METIIFVISSIVTSISILLCVCNLYNDGVSFNKKLLFIFVMSIIIYFQVRYTSDLTKLTINYLGMFFSIYFILIDKEINKSLTYSLVIFLAYAFTEIILTILLKTFCNFDYFYDKYTITIHLFNLLVNILVVLITKLKFVRKIANKFKFSNGFLKVLLLFIFALCGLLGEKNKSLINTNSITYIINIMMFFFIILIVYIIIDINNKNNEISNKYNQMMEYMTEYEKIIDEQGKMNHEYKNQLLILNGFIDNKKRLKEYLNTIIEDHKTGQNYEIRQLSHFPNGGLKGLLYYKISKMKENNIKYFLYVSKEVNKPLEKLDIKDYKSITKIFGVLIDNAIDASIKSSNKEIILDFKMDDNYIVITITNSFNDNIELSKLGTGYTTKGKNHGYGLKLVKDIIKNNKNLELVTDNNENEFSQTLLIDTK